jgi:hypothetical protein
VLESTFREAGYVAFDINVSDVPPSLTDDMRGFWGGYKIDFKIIEQSRYEALRNDLAAMRRHATAVGRRGSTKFRIDISRHEYCRPKMKRELDGYRIYVYSPEMAVAEKVRAICQQMPEYVRLVGSHPSARARDFVDIHTVAEHFRIDFAAEPFVRLVREVFAAKRVPLRLIPRIADFREYHRADFPAVKDTVKAGVVLEAFDFYFDYVLAQCRLLKTLWDE